MIIDYNENEMEEDTDKLTTENERISKVFFTWMTQVPLFFAIVGLLIIICAYIQKSSNLVSFGFSLSVVGFIIVCVRMTFAETEKAVVEIKDSNGKVLCEKQASELRGEMSGIIHNIKSKQELVKLYQIFMERKKSNKI